MSNNIFGDFFGSNPNIDTVEPLHKLFGLNSKKASSILRDLECTLEDLYFGSTKKFRITRKRLNGTSEIKNIEIEIKSGWKDGTKITYENLGDEIQDMSPADIIFIVKTSQHPKFSRNGDDLILTTKIPYHYTQNDFSKQIDLISKKIMTINVPTLKNKREFIIEGCGMPIRKKKEQCGYGNLIIKFIVIG